MAPSLKKLIEPFVESLTSEKGYSENTCRAYNHDLEEFLLFIAKNRHPKKNPQDAIELTRVKDIDGLTIREYLGFLHKKKNKKSSIARKLSTLRSFFKYLVRQGDVSDNPAETVLTPKQEKTIPTYLTVDDMFRLLDSIKTDTLLGLRNRAIFETLYSTGVRVSELSGMNVSNVDIPSQIIRVLGKGRKERMVPVGKKALAAITAYRKRLEKEEAISFTTSDGPLFLNKNKGRLTARSIGRILDKTVRECALLTPVSPHGLRHTFATHMLDSGADLRIVQELLGHISLSTTQKYTHVTIDKLMETYDSAHPRK